ncbi:RUN and FYVE domain containing 2 [Phyllostomus discolor]|uniref:RUN and FYVE domain containing 2 n=1 Tax=Phyllostomus discolor TaxID=89673 RepID=A0A834AHN0_9CHIR|nr:RUN and FYVE domain containing 2 [Phyllostomus discolor]
MKCTMKPEGSFEMNLSYDRMSRVS